MALRQPDLPPLSWFSTPLLGVLVLSMAGCVQTRWQSGNGPSQTLATADQMMDVEQADRVQRFQRLAWLHGITPPQVTQASIEPFNVPGATRPIPVIRVVFDEAVFFDSGSAVPRSEAGAVLDVIADNMRHDVPDIRVTLLGHTDATGSDTVNDALSRQRALAVLQILVRDGVNPGQLGTVAIGRAQPRAPNDSAVGRARNRRVEFLISSSEAANLRVVQAQPVNPEFLRTGTTGTAPVRTRTAIQFLKPAYAGPADFSEAPAEKKRIVLAANGEVPLQGFDAAPPDPANPVLNLRPGPPHRSDAAETGSPAAPVARSAMGP